MVAFDVVGIVKSAGNAPECAKFYQGAKVFGVAYEGSLAEYVVVNCAEAALAPTTITDNEIAGLSPDNPDNPDYPNHPNHPIHTALAGLEALRNPE